MVRLRRTEDRRRYEGISAINEADVERALDWANGLRTAVLQFLKNEAENEDY
jgi:hypothetical protein